MVTAQEVREKQIEEIVKAAQRMLGEQKEAKKTAAELAAERKAEGK